MRRALGDFQNSQADYWRILFKMIQRVVSRGRALKEFHNLQVGQESLTSHFGSWSTAVTMGLKSILFRLIEALDSRRRHHVATTIHFYLPVSTKSQHSADSRPP